MDQAIAKPGDGGTRAAGPWTVAGRLFALVGLVWVLRDLNLSDLRGHLVHANWWWIAAALIADTVSYVGQGCRWRMLLGRALTLARATQAIYAGLFVNEVLPMRPGEVLRAYLAARWTRTETVAVIPSMVVERLFDGIWVALGIGLTAAFVPLPGNLKHAAEVFGLGIVLATGLFLWLVGRRRAGSRRIGTRLPRRIAGLLDKFDRELAAMAQSLVGAFLTSFVYQFLQLVAFWFVMRGCGLPLPFPVAAAVFLIVHLGTALPSAPANIGSYQFFTVLGLTLFGVDKAAATGFSIVVFVLLTLPLLVLGSLAFSRAGMTLAGMNVLTKESS